MLKIREMTFDDIEDVVRIETSVFSVPWDANGFLSFMIREGTVFLVAQDDDGICAVFGKVFGGKDRICVKFRSSLARNSFPLYIVSKG